MGFGSATKKISMVADMADEVYTRLNDLREQVQEMRATVRATNERVEQLERAVEGQTAVIEALAEQQGIDVDQVYADAAIREAETTAVDGDDPAATGGEGATGDTDDTDAGDESPGGTDETSRATDEEPTPKTD